MRGNGDTQEVRTVAVGRQRRMRGDNSGGQENGRAVADEGGRETTQDTGR
jgi:hypothetical protein